MVPEFRVTHNTVPMVADLPAPIPISLQPTSPLILAGIKQFTLIVPIQ